MYIHLNGKILCELLESKTIILFLSREFQEYFQSEVSHEIW